MDDSEAIKKVQAIQNLPTLPAIAMEVNHLLQDMETSIDDLVQMLEKDQSLAMKLLRLVNSSFYGFKNKVNSLKHAVTLMGYNTLQNAVATIAVVDALQLSANLKDFKTDSFWQHAIRVAVLSRYLAARTHLAPVEAAFTAGLIHDVGKVVLVNSFPQDLMAVIFEMQNKAITFSQAESNLAVCPHGVIGSYLARRWMLPESLAESIEGHHDAVARNALTYIVGFANSLVHLMDEDAGYRLPGEQGHETVYNPIMDVLRDGNRWFLDVKKEMDEACRFFEKR